MIAYKKKKYKYQIQKVKPRSLYPFTTSDTDPHTK